MVAYIYYIIDIINHNIASSDRLYGRAVVWNMNYLREKNCEQLKNEIGYIQFVYLLAGSKQFEGHILCEL